MYMRRQIAQHEHKDRSSLDEWIHEDVNLSPNEVLSFHTRSSERTSHTISSVTFNLRHNFDVFHHCITTSQPHYCFLFSLNNSKHISFQIFAEVIP